MANTKLLASVVAISFLIVSLGGILMLWDSTPNSAPVESISATVSGETLYGETNSTTNETPMFVPLSITNGRTTTLDPGSLNYTASLSNGKTLVGVCIEQMISILPGESMNVTIMFQIGNNDWNTTMTVIRCSDSIGYVDITVNVTIQQKVNDSQNDDENQTIDEDQTNDQNQPDDQNQTNDQTTEQAADQITDQTNQTDDQNETNDQDQMNDQTNDQSDQTDQTSGQNQISDPDQTIDPANDQETDQTNDQSEQNNDQNQANDQDQTNDEKPTMEIPGTGILFRSIGAVGEQPLAAGPASRSVNGTVGQEVTFVFSVDVPETNVTYLYNGQPWDGMINGTFILNKTNDGGFSVGPATNIDSSIPFENGRAWTESWNIYDEPHKNITFTVTFHEAGLYIMSCGVGWIGDHALQFSYGSLSSDIGVVIEDKPVQGTELPITGIMTRSLNSLRDDGTRTVRVNANETATFVLSNNVTPYKESAWLYNGQKWNGTVWGTITIVGSGNFDSSLEFVNNVATIPSWNIYQEPEHQATFTVTFHDAGNYTVISNVTAGLDRQITYTMGSNYSLAVQVV